MGMKMEAFRPESKIALSFTMGEVVEEGRDDDEG